VRNIRPGWPPSSRIARSYRSLLAFFPALRTLIIDIRRFVYNSTGVLFDTDFVAIRSLQADQGAVFLDVGGNRGFAIDAILLQNKTCRVVSFEPNPRLAAKTRKRFKDNARVAVHGFGLGDREGEFTLFVPVYRGYEFDGLASLNIEHARSWLKDGNLYWYKEDKIKEYKCTIKRSDDLELDPFSMKLDVQGHEIAVLRGGEKTIRVSRPILLIEEGSNGKDIVQFLRRFGYRQYGFRGGKFDPDMRRATNSFFMTEDRFRLVRS
jgi:FkbM family methyltransferase